MAKVAVTAPAEALEYWRGVVDTVARDDEVHIGSLVAYEDVDKDAMQRVTRCGVVEQVLADGHVLRVVCAPTTQEQEQQREACERLREEIHTLEAEAQAYEAYAQQRQQLVQSVQAAESKVMELTLPHLNEIMSYSNPSTPIVNTLSLIVDLLNIPLLRRDWYSIKAALKRENFRSRIINFNVHDMSKSERRNIMRRMNDTQLLSDSSAQNASHAVVPLVHWMRAQLALIEHEDPADSSRPREEALLEKTRDMTTQRQDIQAAKQRLQEMESEASDKGRGQMVLRTSVLAVLSSIDDLNSEEVVLAAMLPRDQLLHYTPTKDAENNKPTNDAEENTDEPPLTPPSRRHTVRILSTGECNTPQSAKDKVVIDLDDAKLRNSLQAKAEVAANAERELRDKLEQLQKEHDAAMNSAQARAADTEAGLQSELNALRAEVAHLQQLCKQQSGQLAEANAEAEKLREAKAQAETELAAAKEHEEAVKDEARQIVDAVKKEFSLAKPVAQNKALHDELEQLQAQLADKHKQAEEQQKQAEQLQAQLADKHKQAEQLQAQLADKQKQSEELQRACDAAVLEREALRTAMQANEEAAAAAERELRAQLASAVTELRTEFDGLRLAIHDARSAASASVRPITTDADRVRDAAALSAPTESHVAAGYDGCGEDEGSEGRVSGKCVSAMPSAAETVGASYSKAVAASGGMQSPDTQNALLSSAQDTSVDVVWPSSAQGAHIAVDAQNSLASVDKAADSATLHTDSAALDAPGRGGASGGGGVSPSSCSVVGLDDVNKLRERALHYRRLYVDTANELETLRESNTRLQSRLTAMLQ